MMIAKTLQMSGLKIDSSYNTSLAVLWLWLCRWPGVKSQWGVFLLPVVLFIHLDCLGVS